jgi:hypothetical protein
MPVTTESGSGYTLRLPPRRRVYLDPTDEPRSALTQVAVDRWLHGLPTHPDGSTHTPQKPIGAGAANAGPLVIPTGDRMSTTTAESTDTTYLVTFERIGLHHTVSPLHARVRDAEHLAQVIDTYARPFLLHGDVEVVVSLRTMLGLIMCGTQCGGAFTLVVERTPVELLRAAADAVGHGPARDHYQRATAEHERNRGLCPAGSGGCWFERQARDELAAARKPAGR